MTILLGTSVWTENNDTEAEYGAWEFTLAGALEEERKLNPPQFPPDIWPHWAEGVPTLLRHSGWCEGFTKNGVTHRSRPSIYTIDLEWLKPRNLSSLADNYGHLPGLWTREWSGVYRVFVEGQPIDRLLGKDPTGTLYLGMAGSGERNSSIMRTRLMGLAKRRNHQVADRWIYNKQLENRFPWKSLLIEWAFTPPWINERGEERSGAPPAEGNLLSCYRDSFGEYPPFNEKN